MNTVGSFTRPRSVSKLVNLCWHSLTSPRRADRLTNVTEAGNAPSGQVPMCERAASRSRALARSIARSRSSCERRAAAGKTDRNTLH